MTDRIWFQRAVLVLWLLWSVTLLTMYYEQLWSLFKVGPLHWVSDNYSLAFLPSLKQWFTNGLLDRGLPAFNEALMRAGYGVFGAGVVVLSTQVLGSGICNLLHCNPENWQERLLYRTSLGFGTLAYISLIMAFMGIYTALHIRILHSLVLLFGSTRLYLYFKHAAKKKPVIAIKPASGNHSHTADKVWITIALLAVLIAFVGAIAPEREYDALWYHLHFPKVWLEKGYLVDLPAEYVSLYPMTWELIFGSGLTLGGPVAAKLLHFVCLLLIALLTYQMTRRFLPDVSPWLAVALFVTVPTILWEASTAYIDLALTMYTGLSLYALLNYVVERRKKWLVLASLNLGLALATKHLAIFVLIIATSGLALYLWLEHRSFRRAILPAAAFAVLSLLLPLPWYIRSWLASGNPFFPELYGIFGALPDRWDAITQQGLNKFLTHFGQPRTVTNLLTLPWDMTVHAARYGGTLGPIFLLFLPAYIISCRFSRISVLLLLFVILYIALWSSPMSSFQMRFLVPITPVLAVLAAEAFERLVLFLRDTRWLRSAIQGAVAGLLLFNLPPWTSLHEADRVGWDGWLTHVMHRIPLGVVIGEESQENYLTRTVPSYAAWRYINTHLPDNTRVLTFSGGDHFYSERDRIWSDATITRSVTWGSKRGQERQALNSMSDLGISHVLFDKKQISSLEAGALAITEPSMLTRWFDIKYEDSRFVLYRVNWEKIKGQGYIQT